MANNKRGRRAKSPDVLKLTGQYRADRHGDRKDMEMTGTPVCPPYLHGPALELWDFVVPLLIEQGAAKAADTPALAALCEWWGEYRKAADETMTEAGGLKDLAVAIESLAAACMVNDVSEMAFRVIGDVGNIIEGRSMQEKRRLDRMAKAWDKFFSIASRFGLTAIDRQGLKGGDTNADNPFLRFIESRTV